MTTHRTIVLALLVAVWTGCGGEIVPTAAVEAVPDAAPTVDAADAGADCHAVYTFHSSWPISCDDAGNCAFFDAGAP